MNLKLAAVQMPVARELDANLPKMLRYIDRASSDEADLLLFPEGALSGYHGEIDQEQVEDGLSQLRRACAAGGVCALVGTSYREGQSVYNQVRVYDDGGRYLGAHSKTLTTGGDLQWTTPGGGTQVFEHKGLCFGAMICNDLWCTPPCPAPDTHLVQQIAQAGGKAVFHAINSGADQGYLKWHTAHQELYARVYGVYILAANAAQPSAVNAPTGLLSPRGEWLAQAERLGEQYITHDIEVD